MKIHLHVGAHKTATTYMQALLSERLAALNAEGIGYMPLIEFRREFTSLLPKLPADTFDNDEKFAAYFPHGIGAALRGVVMSEENLIGNSTDLLLTGVLYARADKRLALVRQLTARHDVTLFMCVRSYETFLPSMYCEAIRHLPSFVPFDQFRERLDLTTCRWPHVLARFVDILRPTGVVVWRFEEFGQTAPAVMRKLAFDTDTQFTQSRAQRISFSQTAVDILHEIAARHGPDVAGRVVKPVAEALPKGEDFAAFDPWTQAEHQELREMYAEDCAKLPGSLVTSPVDLPTQRGGFAGLVSRVRTRLAPGGAKLGPGGSPT